MINKLKQCAKNLEAQNLELQALIIELLLENKKLKNELSGYKADKADKFIRNALDK